MREQREQRLPRAGRFDREGAVCRAREARRLAQRGQRDRVLVPARVVRRAAASSSCITTDLRKYFRSPARSQTLPGPVAVALLSDGSARAKEAPRVTRRDRRARARDERTHTRLANTREVAVLDLAGVAADPLRHGMERLRPLDARLHHDRVVVDLADLDVLELPVADGVDLLVRDIARPLRAALLRAGERERGYETDLVDDQVLDQVVERRFGRRHVDVAQLRARQRDLDYGPLRVGGALAVAALGRAGVGRGYY